MKHVMCMLWVLLASIYGCTPQPTAVPGGALSADQVMPWPPHWASYLGRKVTLEGTAAEAKLGPLLQGEGGVIWIDGLESWPKGFVAGAGQGKRLRVSGIVIRKDDVPVFVQRLGEPSNAGMAVHSAAEREQASWRYLLQNATWVVLE